MKSITKLFTALAFVCLADSAWAGFNVTTQPVDITYETPFPGQFQMVRREPLKMGIQAPPNRRIIMRVYKLHPSGICALHQRVAQKEFRISPALLNYTIVSINGLEFGTGVRYSVTFEAKNNLRTAARLRASSVWGIYYPVSQPIFTTYPISKGPSPRVATAVQIEEE
jgi:hypothetical protein